VFQEGPKKPVDRGGGDLEKIDLDSERNLTMLQHPVAEKPG
jgi:hypothetical protein